MAKVNAKSTISTTKTAIYLLRFNVALQIAILAIAVNLLLAIFTFLNGLNALYCAFGIDCVIGVITSCILVWRFASSKKESIEDMQDQHTFILVSYREGYGYTKSDALCDSIDYFDSNIKFDDLDHQRELWSTFWLGQVMVMSGIGVVIRTAVELVAHFSLHAHGLQTELNIDIVSLYCAHCTVHLSSHLFVAEATICFSAYLFSSKPSFDGIQDPCLHLPWFQFDAHRGSQLLYIRAFCSCCHNLHSIF